MYENPLAMTQQFRFCGNPLRVDTYLGCTHGCRYCFANSRQGRAEKADVANLDASRRLFVRSRKEFNTKNIDIELLQHGVPLHLGGMSDPFQHREKVDKKTWEFLKISLDENYPVMISTKGIVSPEHFERLDPKLHVFQISLIGMSDAFIREHESATPLPQERLNQIKLLKDKGFWVSVRIQPLIDLSEALSVVLAVNGIADYLTVEHLKIPEDNPQIWEDYRRFYHPDKYYKPSSVRNSELRPQFKLPSIQEIKKVAQMPVGCGDNDMHYLSQSRCCCGMDVIGGPFDNYLKYNMTYMVTGEVTEEEKAGMFLPRCSPRGVFYEPGPPELTTFKQYVDKYLDEHQCMLPPDPNQGDLFSEE